MTNDPLLLIGLVVGVIIVFWLVFSVLKNVIGFLVLGAAVFSVYLLWTNPALLDRLLDMLPG